jgi:2-polyprenyl-6-methoxyphenol hydroxylase-like FAD-dependent oxidoreductase
MSKTAHCFMTLQPLGNADCYRNLLGVGGFLPPASHPPISEEKAMVFTFGPNGFFGYSGSSHNDTMWWSTCEASDVPPSIRLSVQDMRAQLTTRHGKWKDPVIQAIIEKAEVESIYPVWTTPELPYWGKDGCVLVGDAAHALQPTSGQGSSQALEDAKTLALCLERFLSRSVEAGASSVPTEEAGLTPNEALELTNKVYFQVRNPRISKIVERTKMMANRKKEQGFAEEMITCFFLWLVGKVPSIGKFSRNYSVLYQKLSMIMEMRLHILRSCHKFERTNSDHIIYIGSIHLKILTAFKLGLPGSLGVSKSNGDVALNMLHKNFWPQSCCY